MVQENGSELSEKASCYKGVFYNYLSIGITLMLHQIFLSIISHELYIGLEHVQR